MIIVIIGAPFLIIKALAGGHGVRERLGYVEERESNKKLFWFHAASVGELKILSLIIPKLRERYNNLDFAVSTTTITGKVTVLRLLGDDIITFLHPIELKSAVKRVIDRIKPDRLIIVETELWPLVLTVARQNGVKLYLINGRMSAKSFKWYNIFKPLFATVMGKFEKVVLQTEQDRKRYEKLGAKDVSVVGNIKYDQVLTNGEVKSPEIIFDNNYSKFVAGSLRKGEEDFLLESAKKTYSKNLPYQFIFVPRHMKDVDGLCNKIKEQSMDYILWSEYDGHSIKGKTILIVNTMGELLSFYKIADIAFVGGSLVPIGGHDPVEPASLGKSVIFGPHMDNASEAAAALLESGGAIEVNNTDDILSFIEAAVNNRDILRDRGKKCRDAVKSLTGASEKTIQLLMEDKV
jgi:3-deoxy-D-manno-octulosonic-acid transferase